MHPIRFPCIVPETRRSPAGEMMVFGHPGGPRTPHLVRVPWHVVKDVPRKVLEKGGRRDGTESIRDAIRKMRSVDGISTIC